MNIIELKKNSTQYLSPRHATGILGEPIEWAYSLVLSNHEVATEVYMISSF